MKLKVYVLYLVLLPGVASTVIKPQVRLIGFSGDP